MEKEEESVSKANVDLLAVLYVIKSSSLFHKKHTFNKILNLQGPAGYRGLTGQKGDQGFEGPPGKHGKEGPPGWPGMKGVKGAPGDFGRLGLDGAKV